MPAPLVRVSMELAVDTVPVVLVGGERASGLADMLRQFIEQVLADSPHKVRQARALSGRAMVRSTEDEDVCVCITFAGDHIELRDGAVEQGRVPSIAADFLTMAHLTSGQENPFWLLVRRKLDARFTVAQVPFLLRMLRFMQIGSTSARTRWVRWTLLLAALVAILVVAGWYLTTIEWGGLRAASATTRTSGSALVAATPALCDPAVGAPERRPLPCR